MPLSQCSCCTQRVNRFCDGNFGKPHLVARPQLSDAMHVGSDDVGDLGIAAGGLLIDEQNNRLPILRHLNGAERNAVGQQL